MKLEYSRGNGQVSDVTGSAGVTGRYLAKAVISKNIKVKKVVKSLQMPIPPAAHYISCPLQPHLLYHFVAAAQQFVVRRVSEQQGEELQGGRVEDGGGDGEAGAGQG